MWTLRWEEKPEGEAKLKGSREANLAQDQAGVDAYVGPSLAPKSGHPHTCVTCSRGCYSNGDPRLRGKPSEARRRWTWLWKISENGGLGICHHPEGRGLPKGGKQGTWIQPNSLSFREGLPPKGGTEELGSTTDTVQGASPIEGGRSAPLAQGLSARHLLPRKWWPTAALSSLLSPWLG